MHKLVSGLGLGVFHPCPKLSNLATTGSSLVASMLKVGAQSTLHPAKVGNLKSAMHFLNAIGPGSNSALTQSRNEDSHC